MISGEDEKYIEKSFERYYKNESYNNLMQLKNSFEDFDEETQEKLLFALSKVYLKRAEGELESINFTKAKLAFLTSFDYIYLLKKNGFSSDLNSKLESWEKKLNSWANKDNFAKKLLVKIDKETTFINQNSNQFDKSEIIENNFKLDNLDKILEGLLRLHLKDEFVKKEVAIFSFIKDFDRKITSILFSNIGKKLSEGTKFSKKYNIDYELYYNMIKLTGSLSIYSKIYLLEEFGLDTFVFDFNHLKYYADKVRKSRANIMKRNLFILKSEVKDILDSKIPREVKEITTNHTKDEILEFRKVNDYFCLNLDSEINKLYNLIKSF